MRIPPYVIHKKAEIAKRVAWLQSNRVQRYRSPIFNLPEFADSPMLSVIVVIRSEQEMKNLTAIKDASVSEQIDWIAVGQAGIQAASFSTVVQYVRTENDCMVLNRAAVQSTGKIILLFSSLSAIRGVDLASISETIRTSEEQLIVVSFDHTRNHIALTRDLFLLARGLDEMFPDVRTAMQDLALRAELLGAKLDKTFTPSPMAKVNVSKGELMVNEGSDNFRKLFFEPH